MRKWTLSCITISFLSGLLVSCTKEKETVIIQERTAPAKIESSLTVSKNTFELAKSSLGKAFLLLPSVKTSSRASNLSFMRPLVISFEKHADKIGIFNLTSQNIYENFKAQSLMQTFSILSEIEDKIVVDLDKGFQSLDLKPGVDSSDHH